MGSDAISCGNEVVGANWCDCADAVGLVRLSMAKAGPRRRLGRRRGWDNWWLCLSCRQPLPVV